MCEQIRELLRVKLKQVFGCVQGNGSPKLQGRLQEDAEGPQQGADGKGVVLLGDAGVEEQRAGGPRGALVLDAVAAVPATGGVVAALVAAVAGVVSAAVLSVARTEIRNRTTRSWVSVKLR